MLSPNIRSNSSLLSDVEIQLRSFCNNNVSGSGSGSSDCTYVKSVVMVVVVVVVVGS